MDSRQPPPVFNSSPASPWGRISSSGFLHATRGLAANRILGQYAVVLVLRGRGMFRHLESPPTQIGAGSLLLVYPEAVHRYWAQEDEDWDEFFIIFEGSAFDHWHEDGLFPATPHLQLKNPQFWLSRLRQACSLPTHPRPLDNLRSVTSLLDTLAALCGSDEVTTTSSMERAWLDRACAMLAPGGQADSMPEIARRCGVSYETFRRRFIAQMGVSPVTYRNSQAIQEACRLIASEHLTNGELAEHLGFCNEFYFSKCFKKATGITPSHFRATSCWSKNRVPFSKSVKTVKSV